MLIRQIVAALCLTSCAPHHLQTSSKPASVSELTLIDETRRRPVPVLLYGSTGGRPKPLAIISHGYGGHNGDYSFLAAYLAGRGYLVASIEHLERPGDPPMAKDGNLALLRRPVWQVGVGSIGFVIRELARKGLSDTSPALVIGHSNGGDMAMLFATEYPEKVRIALSFDNRRMPLPRVRKPKICSLRSSDYGADPGVLPLPPEQAKLGMLILRVPVKHDDMWDGATSEQKDVMLKAVASCLGKQRGVNTGRPTAGS